MAAYKNKILGGTIFIVCLLLAVFGSLFFYQKAYADRIYRNVYVANVDLSGLSKKQATYVVSKYYKQILDKEIAVKAGDKEVKTRLADTGVSFDVNQVVEKSYGVGRSDTIYNRAISIIQTLWQKKKIIATPKIDKAKYDAFVNLIVPQLNQDPTDATLKIEDGKIIETKEAEGQKADIEDITREIVNLTNTPEAVLTLKATTVPPAAKVTDFSEARAFAQASLDKKITLTYANFAFTPTAVEIGQWTTFSNQNGKLVGGFDDSNIKAYLNKIASNFEIQKVNKKVNALDGSTIVEGKEGKYLDKDKALAAIKQAFQSQGSTSIALVVNTEAPGEDKVVPSEGLVPGRFPGKYIDVDLTQQRLCTMEGNNTVKCYIVSTGKPSTPTPVGTRTIDSKNERKWSYEFGLWMPWWESLGEGYGIHELPEWPSGYKEGEAHLGTPVSHGCIRLGIGAAQEVFNWTEIGTPVYIHK